AGEIPSWPAQALNGSGVQHAIDHCHDCDPVSSALGSSHAWTAKGHDNVNANVDHLLHQRRQAFGPSFDCATFNTDVAPLDQPLISEPMHECAGAEIGRVSTAYL